jgi:periplasmic protein CpxP/Spy
MNPKQMILAPLLRGENSGSTVFAPHLSSLQGFSGEKWRKILMNKVLCCLAQIGVLVAGLVCGAPGFAQEPGFPPETSAPPPKQGPSGGHHGMMDPDEQLARMTTRYSLTTEQQDQVKPILVSQQHQIQGLRQDTALSREDRMAKTQTIRSDSDAKIKAVLNDDQKKQFEQDQLRMQKRVQQGQDGGPNGGTPPR